MEKRRLHVPQGVRTLGEAIRLLREGQGMTLRALADKVGLSAPFLSDLERGRRQTDRHEEIARALGIPEAELRQLDSRVTTDLKDWLAENPKLVALLKDMQGSAEPVPLEALRSALKNGR
jgi:transcriptional regulator with XRE-family HTH domain